jgi:hypothetical protein
MLIGGLAGSHSLLFVPVWYLVLGTVIAGSHSTHGGRLAARSNAPGTAQMGPGFSEAVSLEG